MFKKCTGGLLAAALVAMFSTAAHAQYFTQKVISLAEAKKMAAAASAEAVKNNWKIVIAVVDNEGGLIYFERADGAQAGSLDVAIGKARTAALFRRSTKAMEDIVNGSKDAPGRITALKLFPLPAQGGLPVKAGDEFVGAMGCSGGTSAQDEQVCAAGIAAGTK
ncbi:MAG TPA: heme-binding protein [bacterium]